MEDGFRRGGCRVRQLLPLGKGDLDRNSAKSPGNAVLQEGSTSTRQLQCRSREAGSSPKLCQTFYRRRTEVWGMDLSEMAAEFGSCGQRWEGKRTEEMQNRLEVQFSRKDRMREGSYDGEVGSQGQPQNFVRSSIEGRQKFWGWICPRWA